VNRNVLLEVLALFFCAADADQADILATGEHLLGILASVGISVAQTRDASQLENYEQTNLHVLELENSTDEALASAGIVPLAAVRASMEALASDTAAALIDVRFQVSATRVYPSLSMAL
jgi:hypothetical protein